MTTSLMPLPAGVQLGGTPTTSLQPAPPGQPGRTSTTLVSALNTVLAPLTGAITRVSRRIRRVGRTPMPAIIPPAGQIVVRPRVFAVPAINPSVLDRDTAAYVKDALEFLVTKVLRHGSVSWQTASRFLGYLQSYAEVGCGINAQVVEDEWDKLGGPMLICGGPFEKFLPAGLALLKQHAGYPADAELEPIFLWLGVVEAIRGEPLPAA